MRIKRLITFVSLSTVIMSSVFAQTENSRTTFSNLELPALRAAQVIGAMDPRQNITFTVWLKLRNKAELDKFVSELFDSHSPKYQKFLRNNQFNARYAPSMGAFNSVQSYFTKRGMRAEKVYSNVRVTATAKQIEQVFQLKMNNYRFQNKVFYGNAGAPSIPADLAKYITGVSGLSNIPYAHPKYHQLRKIAHESKPSPLKLAWKSFKPAVTPTTTSFGGFTGAQLRTTYNLAGIPPINGTTIDGAGQTMVIIDGCGNATPTEIMNHANDYNTANNLPLISVANFAVVNPDGSPYTGSCANPSGWDGEINLDVQASHTIAPGANIVLVLTDNVNNAQVAQAINYITTNNYQIGGFSNAYVLSNSWDNTYEEPSEPLDATLEAATAMGLSINFAAGDCGDQTYNSGWTCSKLSNTPSVEYPVSSAYVTAVSGTSVFVDNNWNYAFETGWGTLVGGSFYSGSMGGISQYQAAPAWQSSISNFTAGGYTAGTVGQYNMRALPDIAMLADLYTGLLTYSSSCSPCYDGGASLATPLFSGTLTLVNQARSILAGGVANPIGLAAPYFYTKNSTLINAKAINLITPPHQIISGASPISGGPISAFKIYDTDFSQVIGFNWDSSLTIIEDQFWNDVVGVGSPNIPNFVGTMAAM